MHQYISDNCSTNDLYLLMALIDQDEIDIIPALIDDDDDNNYINYTHISRQNILKFFNDILTLNNEETISDLFYDYIKVNIYTETESKDILKLDRSILSINDLIDLVKYEKRHNLYINLSENDKYGFIKNVIKFYSENIDKYLPIIFKCRYLTNNQDFNNKIKVIEDELLNCSLTIVGKSIYTKTIEDNIYRIYILDNYFNRDNVIRFCKNLYNLIYPICDVSSLSAENCIYINFNSMPNVTIIINNRKEYFTDNILSHDTIRLTRVYKNDCIYSLHNDNVNEIISNYHNKLITFVENKFDFNYIYQHRNGIINAFCNLEKYISDGYRFNKIIPFTYSDIIYYNIPQSVYIELLSEYLIDDVSSIIMDYLNIPDKYVPCSNLAIPLFFYSSTI